MKIAARELNLLGLTLAVVLLALSYLALEPLFQEWADFRAQREDLLARQAAAQQLLDSRPDVEARLEEFRQGLPTFPAGKKVEVASFASSASNHNEAKTIAASALLVGLTSQNNADIAA